MASPASSHACWLVALAATHQKTLSSAPSPVRDLSQEGEWTRSLDL